MDTLTLYLIRKVIPTAQHLAGYTAPPVIQKALQLGSLRPKINQFADHPYISACLPVACCSSLGLDISFIGSFRRRSSSRGALRAGVFLLPLLLLSQLTLTSWLRGFGLLSERLSPVARIIYTARHLESGGDSPKAINGGTSKDSS